ncbi:Hypothetical protein A7982_11632 [Minicystis rosea]|nr:Hypothetical protein A7982_11632 [Minicystis rosea]
MVAGVITPARAHRRARLMVGKWRVDFLLSKDEPNGPS